VAAELDRIASGMDGGRGRDAVSPLAGKPTVNSTKVFNGRRISVVEQNAVRGNFAIFVGKLEIVSLPVGRGSMAYETLLL
jgi:hypothetical protein